MSAPNRLRDPQLSILHDFYEPLAILDILGPFVGPRSQGSLRTSDSAEVIYTPLQRFLDRLSWMCDYESGGETVVAISLERSLDGTIFWLAASHKAMAKTETHLRNLLSSLQSAHNLSAKELYKLGESICDTSIAFASDRVGRYTRTFHYLHNECRETLESSNQLLGRDLSHLANLESMPIRLCAAADQFRDSESLRLLSHFVSKTASPSMWSLLRHYIGRLGSWHRATRTIVDFASTRPDIFTNFRLKGIRTPKPIEAPRLDVYTRLQSALSRMFPAQEQLELGQAVEALQRLRHFDLDMRFRENYRDKNFKPRVHVEAWLLEHFHDGNLPFVDDDRYIGCSKPSCYCCNLYFQYHPGKFARRPSHGNVWPNWQTPLHQDDDKQAHDASMKQAMITKFREDLKNKLIQPGANLRRIPDTTTGFTPSET